MSASGGSPETETRDQSPLEQFGQKSPQHLTLSNSASTHQPGLRLFQV